MQWFANLKISTKLIVCAAFAAVLNVSAGAFSLRQLVAINVADTEMYEKVVAPYGDVSTLVTGVEKARRGLRDQLLARTAAEREAANAESEEALYLASSSITSLERLEVDSTTKAALAAVRAAFDAWEAPRTQVLELLASGRREAATRSLFDESNQFAGTLSSSITSLEATLAERGDAISKSNSALATRTIWLVSIALVLCFVLFIACGFWIARQIANPINVAVATLERVAAGDLTARCHVTSRDEVGRLATALNDAAASMQSSIQEISTNAQALAAASEELSAVASEMGANASQTSSQAGVVSSAADEVSRNVQTVAAGTEQMGASIKEIAGNAAQAAQVALGAVQTADKTNATISQLGVASQQIGAVIKTITSIAEQTNLLALNATIEAARAGEAGKGFAVVANEVKELAKETARATEDIARRIEAIQGNTDGAVTAIGEISGVIRQLNDISGTIASAVEQQAATTGEIGRNVEQAARGAHEIAGTITDVASAAQSTTQGAQNAQGAAHELAAMAASLQQLVGRFTVTEREHDIARAA